MKPRFRNFLLLAGSSLLAISSASATTLYWDGTNTTANADGGAGTWNDGLNNNWDTLIVSGLNAAWTAGDTAVFGGTAGTVTLGSDITVNGLRFNTISYILASDTGLRTLNFGSGDNTILFNNIAAASTSSSASAGLKLGGTGNVILTASNPATAGTLTLQYSVAGDFSTGWSGTTTINPGMTLALAGRDLSLSSTSGITLNGGGITLTNTNSTQGAFNRVNNSAGISSNSGTITYTNTSGSGLTYAETLGNLDLNRGQSNIVLTNNMSGGGGNVQTLTLSALSRTANTASISFSGNTTNPNTTTNRIAIGGASDGFVGPWATVGTAAAAQTDYAFITDVGGTKYVTAANIAATAENSGSWIGGANVTLSGATTLTATRTINTLRYTGNAQILSLGTSNFNLQTYGVLNGGSGLLTIQNGTGGSGGLTTPAGGGNLFINTGNNAITVSAPINNNGSDAVTLVKNGTGTLTLSSTTSNFSGGIVLNAGTLDFNAETNLGSGGGITVNGTATINGRDKYDYARALTVNEGAILTSNNGFGVTGVFSGNGALSVTTADSHRFSNAANTFTGAITSATSFNTGYGLEFASIGDTAGAGLITLVGGSGTFHWMSASGSTTTLANRQFAISGTGSGMISARGTTAASNLVINRDLLITGAAGAKSLTLAGDNIGDNTFAGNITDGTDGGTSMVSVDKIGSGKWILTGNNTYTGPTTVTGGTLVISNANALNAMRLVIFAGGTLESTVGTLDNLRYTATGGTIANSMGGSNGFNKFTTGSATLNGTSNTFTGGITVGGGSLAVGASSSLGQNVIGNSILIRDGGILTMAAAANSGSNQAITLSSSFKSGVAISQSAGGAGPVGRLAVLGLGFNGLPNGAISQANTNGGVIAINAVTGYNTDLSSVLTGKNLFLGAIGTSTFTGAAGTVVAGNGSLYRLGGGGGQITFHTTNLFTGGNGVQVGSTFVNGGGTVVIQAAQNYTGATTVSQGTMTLSGANGTATGSSGFTLNGGRLFLDSVGTGNNNTNRIGDSAAVTLSNGGELSLNGNASGTTEAFGNLNIGTGYSTVTATAVTAASTLSGTGFSRTDNGTALFRGTALGQNTTVMGKVTLSDTTGLTFSAGVTLNGATNGTAKDIRIIPYLVGDTATGSGNTFVTYDPTNGFRVLDTTNQFNSSITANTNVRLAAAATGITSNTINSLIHTTGSSTIADGATLTVSSGAILFTGGNINQAGTTGILDFGANTGFITTTANATIGARITGSGGLVKSGASTLTLSNSNNSFTGDIIVNSGTLSVGNNNGMLGNAANNIIVNGHSTLNLSGITYARALALNNGAIATFSSENWTISGNVTGTGGVAFNAGGFSAGGTFSGTNNTFEGPVLIGGSGAGNLNHSVTFASLADSASANGRIVFLASNVNGNTGSRFVYTGGTGGNTNLVLNNRQIELASSVAGSVTNLGHQILNNSAGTGTLTIATDLIVSTPIDQTLALRGTNTGANTFSGVIGNGDARVSLIKNDAGRWILSNSNTFSGSTVVSGGTLELGHSQALQNSPLEASNSITGTASAGLRTTVTTLTIGGLNGTKNLDTLFTSTSGGYGGVTALTLNPVAGVTTSYSGAITNGASGMTLTKTGAGTQILSGTSTYTGATTVTTGTLIVNGNISTSALTTVQTTATLGGSGTVGDLTIDAGGFFSPGNSPGITTVVGDYIQNGTLIAEVSGLNAGTQHDQVVVNGTVTLNGALSLTSFSGFTPVNGDLIFILLNDGVDAITGTFTGLVQGAVVGNYLGFDWQISYTGNSAGNTFTGGNDAVLMAIPEPRAALLGGIGMLMLLRRRRQ